jgi:hypothetical protein
MDPPGRRRSTLIMNGLSAAISNIYVGVGLGEGEAGGGVGDGRGDGAGEGEGDEDGWGDALGDADGLADGEALGEAVVVAVGEAEQVACVPLKKISCDCPPHPRTIPDGWLYQPRILLGRPLTKRAMMVWPTLSPNARIMPPPPLGAVLPTQTPATMSGL